MIETAPGTSPSAPLGMGCGRSPPGLASQPCHLHSCPMLRTTLGLERSDTWLKSLQSLSRTSHQFFNKGSLCSFLCLALQIIHISLTQVWPGWDLTPAAKETPCDKASQQFTHHTLSAFSGIQLPSTLHGHDS